MAGVRAYVGDAKSATDQLANTLGNYPAEEIASLAWADGALVVAFRDAPRYDPIRLVAAGIAAAVLAWAGVNMVSLESQAGNTVAEAFYQYVGYGAFGLAALSIAVGLRKA